MTSLEGQKELLYRILFSYPQHSSPSPGEEKSKKAKFCEFLKLRFAHFPFLVFLNLRFSYRKTCIALQKTLKFISWFVAPRFIYLINREYKALQGGIYRERGLIIINTMQHRDRKLIEKKVRFMYFLKIQFRY